MANLLWGKVYYKNKLAGYLNEETSGVISFTYDAQYLKDDGLPISFNMPLREEAYLSTIPSELPAFFDNLVSEGWLEKAQSALLGRRVVSRFELLLAFGYDCIGAVSVLDPSPAPISGSMANLDDPKELAVITNRASLSGVQPKLSVVRENGKFRASRINELSTHIAKFASQGHPDLVENEYLTTCAFKALLPEDKVTMLTIDTVEGINEQALIIKRFDRNNGERIHFEEFNQLLGYQSNHKYYGCYKDMSKFILNSNACIPLQNFIMFKRILSGLIVGNTDMHLKNFAMFHEGGKLVLTPSYDQVASSLYHYKTPALGIKGASNLDIRKLKPSNIINLGKEFNLPLQAIKVACDSLGENLESAKQSIVDAEFGAMTMKNKLVQQMEKRWKVIFASIGQVLLKKQ